MGGKLILALCQLSNDLCINYERIGITTSYYKLVIIHGAGCSSNDFIPLASYLSNDFECIIMDLPNHGKSGTADTVTIADYTQIVKKFISAVLPDQNIVVIGHSMGGAIALNLAVQNNLNLKGFVILNSAAYITVDEAFFAKLQRGKVDASYMIKNSGTPYNPNVIRFFIRHRDLSKQVQRFYQDFLTTVNFDLRKKLSQIKAAVFAVTGGKDLLATREYANYLKSHIPNCKEKILPRYGHLLPVAAPRKVADAIRSFVIELKVSA